jgi:hypothetical protein
MERPRSRTTDLPHVRDELWLDRDLDKCGGSISVDAGPAVVMTSGPSPRDEGGVKTSGRDSVDKGVFLPSDSLRDQLQAIRRKLWVLNATLESLPAKIEVVCRNRGEEAGQDGGAVSRIADGPRRTRTGRGCRQGPSLS